MTKDPRLTFPIPPETLEAISEFRFAKKFKSQSAAIRALVEKGLEVYMPELGSVVASDQAMRLASDFDTLDEFGRTAVRRTADTELERVKAQRKLAEGESRTLAARQYAGDPIDLSGGGPSLADAAQESDLDF